MENTNKIHLVFKTTSDSVFVDNRPFDSIDTVDINKVNMLSVESSDEALLKEVVTLFPKYCKAEVVSVRSIPFGNYGRIFTYGIIFRFNCFVNKSTGAVNETMEKRRNKVLEIFNSKLK